MSIVFGGDFHMIKALATDLDGTLLRDHKIPSYNQKAIMELKESGNLFIISTGRPYNGVKPLIEEYNLDVDYSVMLNGALIIDGDNKVIKHQCIPFTTIREIITSLEYSQPSVSIETGYITYLLDSLANNLPYDNKVEVDSIDEIKDKDLSLLSLYFEDATTLDIDRICCEINKRFSLDCVAYRNTQYIDVVPVGCSKGNAVKFICEKENVKGEDIYTIGDSFNDISMFNITDNSFTFTECEDSLKEHVGYVVDSVAECITNHLLIDSSVPTV